MSLELRCILDKFRCGQCFATKNKKELTGSGLSLQFRRPLLLVTQHIGHNDDNNNGYNKCQARNKPADHHWTEYWIWV